MDSPNILFITNNQHRYDLYEDGAVLGWHVFGDGTVEDGPRRTGSGGYETDVEKVTCLTTGEEVEFEQDNYRIVLKDLPDECPDPEAGVVVYRLEFKGEPVLKWCPTTPAFVAGWDE